MANVQGNLSLDLDALAPPRHPELSEELMGSMLAAMELREARLTRWEGNLPFFYPYAVQNVALRTEEPLYQVSNDELICRLAFKVILRDEEEDVVGEIGGELLLDFTSQGNAAILESREAVGWWLSTQVPFVAHPFIREAVNTMAQRLGFQSVTLGLLKADSERIGHEGQARAAG